MDSDAIVTVQRAKRARRRARALAAAAFSRARCATAGVAVLSNLPRTLSNPKTKS